MKDDPSTFTFMEHPASFRAQKEDKVAWIPAGISTREALCALLKQQLDLPAYFRKSWNTLYSCLSSLVGSPERRVVIVHEDVPPLSTAPTGRIEAKVYLEVLLQSIQFWEGRNPEKTFVVIFPSESQEQIRTLLALPPAWEMWYGLHEGPALAERYYPTWSHIQRVLEQLHPAMMPRFSLEKDEMGSLDVFALWQGGYYLVHTPLKHYEHPTLSWEKLTLGERMSFVTSLKDSQEQSSLSAMLHIVNHFFQTEALPTDLPSVHWQIATGLQVDEVLHSICYKDDEELFLEWNIGAVQFLVKQHILSTLHEQAFVEGVEAWRAALTSEDERLRLMATCMLGRSGGPQMRELLLPFLKDPSSKAYWVSARFLGEIKDEEILQVLLHLLTAHLPQAPLPPGESWDEWYDGWRRYVPRLLRDWEHAKIVPAMQEALQLNLERESYTEHEYLHWERFREILCYELGYRAVFNALAGRRLADAKVRRALVCIAQGYHARCKRYRSRSEEVQHWDHPLRLDETTRQELLAILMTKCDLSEEEGLKALNTV